MRSSKPPRFRAHILVVDDEAPLREAVAETLRDEGYRVDEAGNGAVALEKAMAQRPDVVVFDYAMPVSGGPALVESLRTYVRPTPVLVGLSAMREASAWCSDHGVPIFIMKPFEDTTLLRAIDTACAQALEARGPKREAGSGTRAITRAACVLAVGNLHGDEGILEMLPVPLRHARLVVVDSPSEAERVLDLIVPDLLVLDDAESHDSLRARARTSQIPMLVRSAAQSVARLAAAAAAPGDDSKEAKG